MKKHLLGALGVGLICATGAMSTLAASPDGELSWAPLSRDDDGGRTYLATTADPQPDSTLLIGVLKSMAVPLDIGAKRPVHSFTAVNYLNCQTSQFRAAYIAFWSGPMGNGERVGAAQEVPDKSWKPAAQLPAASAAFKRFCKR